MAISWGGKEVRCLGGKLREIVPSHLATFVQKTELGRFTCTPSHRSNFRGYPALFLVWKPDPGSFAVDVFGHFNLPKAVDYLNLDLDVITSTANQPPTSKMLYFPR